MSGEGEGDSTTPKKSDTREGDTSNVGEGALLGSKAKDVGSISNKELYMRADKIDFKSWDVQLEKHLSRVWSRDREAPTKKEEWEIDLAKLDIRNVIAHGTYGTVYKGNYDGQDVAGNFSTILFRSSYLFFLIAEENLSMLASWS